LTGRVDPQGRALLAIEVGNPSGNPSLTCEVWIDTGFNGFLVLPQSWVASLGLPLESTGRAVLADGSQIDVKSYLGQLDWFGDTMLIDIIASEGIDGLMGVGLLMGHKLEIDYVQSVALLN
jgi:clan AA aspartic protease